LVTDRFHRLRNAPSLEARRSERIFSRTAAPQDFFTGQLYMRLELFLYLAITWVSSDRSPQTKGPLAQCSHGFLLVIFKPAHEGPTA
jgi:hypothetical protein